MARRVDVGAVIERIRVEGGLDAVVAVWPAARVHDAAIQHGERVGELVALVVVDQVAALDHELRTECADGVGGAREHPRRQGLLGAERRLERSTEPVEERDPCGRRGVEHVGVGDVGERCKHGDGHGAPAELGPVDQWLAGADAELTVSDRVGPGRDEGRARRRGGRGGTGAAAGERERRSAAEGFRQRPAAGDAPCGHGGRGGTRARGGSSCPGQDASPSTTDSRDAWRETHATATPAATAKPASVTNTSEGPAVSDSVA